MKQEETEDFEGVQFMVNEGPRKAPHMQCYTNVVAYLNNLKAAWIVVFLYRLMQYLSYSNGIPTTPLDSKLMRIRYVALLWDIVNRKIQFDAISDSEAPQSLPRIVQIVTVLKESQSIDIF
ncbi:hypothetical protein RDI58_024151 [Solanum bulbocastanum]|uniref:Uncharacterized protein n=1 Tax=Solanum bulbocastanum TaxID=147425 RepID=A0AAN8SXP0_SOLBU